jgi:DNA-binding NarL/FixJ family response regulator
MKDRSIGDHILSDAFFEGRILHARGKIVDCNEAACRIFHYDREELSGLDVAGLVKPEYRAAFLKNIDSGDGVAVPLVGVQKGGLPVHIRAAFSTLTIGRKRRHLLTCCEARGFAGSDYDDTSVRRQLAECQALIVSKDTSIRELITQVEREKRQVEADVTANIDRVILPIIGLLEEKFPRSSRHQLDLIRSCMSDIAGTFVTTIEQLHAKLTPREIQVCHMIRSGFSTKDIAKILNTSVQTVFSQRKQIRRKLHLSGGDANLAAYLKGLDDRRWKVTTS